MRNDHAATIVTLFTGKLIDSVHWIGQAFFNVIIGSIGVSCVVTHFGWFVSVGGWI